MTIFYLLILLLIAQGHFMSMKWPISYKKSYLVLAFFELQAVSGLRMPLGDDDVAYVGYFLEISEMSFSEVLSHGLETGFALLCYFLSFISKDGQFLIFVTSAFMNLMVIVFISRKSKIPWLSVVLYVTLMFFFNVMTLMRFMIACSILLYSNKYILNRSFFKFLIMVLLAASFHFSAWIYLMLYFLYSFKLSKFNLLFVSVTFLSLFVSFSLIFSLIIQVHSRFTSYDGGIGMFYQSSFANILIFVQNILILIFAMMKVSHKLFRVEGEVKLFLWSTFLACVFSLMAINVMILTRFVIMFSILQIVYIPNLIWPRYRIGNYFNIVAAFLAITITQVIVILTYRPEWYFSEPYHNYLFE